jgi:hypothetical protein
MPGEFLVFTINILRKFFSSFFCSEFTDCFSSIKYKDLLSGVVDPDPYPNPKVRGSLDPDLDSQSGSKKAKVAQKIENFPFKGISVYSLLRAEGFLSSLDFLYEDLFCNFLIKK